MRLYIVKYETPQGIITDRIIEAPCKEKVLEAFRNEMKEGSTPWREGSEKIDVCLTKSSKEYNPTLYEDKKRIKTNKNIEKHCLRKAKKMIKHVKNKKWEEKHPEKAKKRKKPNEPINNIQ